MNRLGFSVAATPPFRLDFTANALRRRPVNMIDCWDGQAYSRVLAISGTPVFVEVTQAGEFRSPCLYIRATAESFPADADRQIIDALRRLLGFQLDLRPFYRFAKLEPRLQEISRRFLGLKPPRFASVLEAIVNGIACQQLSLHVGLTLLNRLAERAGCPFETATGARFSFPNANSLAKLSVRTLRRLGFSTNKALALTHLAASILDGAFDPESLVNLANDEAKDRLLALRGVGQWTAEYVLLRGLGRIEIFPGQDVGGRRNLARWLGTRVPLDDDRMNRLRRRWYPYFGFLYFHLLLDRLSSAQSTNVKGSVSASLRRQYHIMGRVHVAPACAQIDPIEIEPGRPC
jgi:DNA-3-methyladenine glycosylase II